MKKNLFTGLVLTILFIQAGAQTFSPTTNTPVAVIRDIIWSPPSSNTYIFAAGVPTSGGNLSGVFRGNGQTSPTWNSTPVNNVFNHGLNLADGNPFSIGQRNSFLYVGVTGTKAGVYRSSLSPVNWSTDVTPALTKGKPHMGYNTFVNTPSYLYLGTSMGVYRTSDDGQNWTACNTGMINDNNTHNASLLIHQLVSYDGVNVYAGTSNGLWKLTNHTLPWVKIGLDGFDVTCVAVTDNYIVAGSANGWVHYTPLTHVQFSTCSGGLDHTILNNVNAIAVVNKIIYIGVMGPTDHNGPYLYQVGQNYSRAHPFFDPTQPYTWFPSLLKGTLKGVFSFLASDDGKTFYMGTTNGVWSAN